MPNYLAAPIRQLKIEQLTDLLIELEPLVRMVSDLFKLDSTLALRDRKEFSYLQGYCSTLERFLEDIGLEEYVEKLRARAYQDMTQGKLRTKELTNEHSSLLDLYSNVSEIKVTEPVTIEKKLVNQMLQAYDVEYGIIMSYKRDTNQDLEGELHQQCLKGSLEASKKILDLLGQEERVKEIKEVINQQDEQYKLLELEEQSTKPSVSGDLPSNYTTDPKIIKE